MSRRGTGTEYVKIVAIVSFYEILQSNNNEEFFKRLMTYLLYILLFSVIHMVQIDWEGGQLVTIAGKASQWKHLLPNA